MLVRGDRLPDFRAPLTSGELFVLSDDAGGLPVVIVVGAPDLEVSALGLVIHVDRSGHPARRGIRVIDDGRIAEALTAGLPGVVVAGRDHRVLTSGPVEAAEQLVHVLTARRPRPADTAPMVPLLCVDDVLEASLCRELIQHLDSVELVDSPSFVPAPSGGATLRVDHGHKHRLDHVVADAALLDAVTTRLRDRLLPEVARSLAHRPTSLETPKIVRYPSGGGWFRAHRDNVTPDTAHRRLAVTVNLDCGYLGGELRFPEIGDDRYRPRPGAAIVFSCGLLHEVTPVDRADRHALITFLW